MFDSARRAVARPQSLPAPVLAEDPVARLDQEVRLAAERMAYLLIEARMAPRRRAAHADAEDDDATFAAPRRPAPVPVPDGMGHDRSLVGIIDPRDSRGIPVRDHRPRTAVRRTASCTALIRDRGTSRATFSGC